MSGELFRTTCWSEVRAAAREGRLDGVRPALEELCRRYREPLRVWLERAGWDAERAEDLVQGFFLVLIERHDLAAADPARGRFRSFLLTSLRHYAADVADKERAQKRGGGASPMPLDETDSVPDATAEEPDRAFERLWAETTVARALERLAAAEEAAGRGARHRALAPWIGGAPSDGGYRGAAESLGVSVGSIKVAVYRLRERFREVLRTVVAETVGSSDEIDDEIRDLRRALVSSPRR